MDDSPVAVTCRGVTNIRWSKDGEVISAVGTLNPHLGCQGPTPAAFDQFRYRVTSLDVRIRAGEPKAGLFLSFADEERFSELAVSVDSDVLARIREHPDSEIVIKVALPLSPKLNDRLLFHCAAELVDLSIMRAVQPAWVDEYKTIEEGLALVVLEPHGGLLARIARELLQSATSRVARDERAFGREVLAIKAIVEVLRRSVRRPPARSQAYALDPADFREHLAKLPEAERKEWAGYDELPYHASARDTIILGRQEQSGERELVTEDLEQAALSYLASRILVSPTLEWFLIDHLMFNETVAFRRSIEWMPKSADGWPVFRAMAWTGIKTLVKEAFAIGLTAFVAGLVDPQTGVGFWAILATVTLARWMKPNQVMAAREKVTAILSDMATAQHTMHRWDFNAGQLRQALYDVSGKGAVFSPCVYSLLDRRIAREAAAYGATAVPVVHAT
jgi:hypothetical protein